MMRWNKNEPALRCHACISWAPFSVSIVWKIQRNGLNKNYVELQRATKMPETIGRFC